MTNARSGGQLIEFLDRVHNMDQTADATDIIPPFFESLTKVLNFSTAIYFRIDPGDWFLKEGHAHDLDPLLIHEYLQYYIHLDPLVIYLPCLKNPNQVVRFSDVTDVAELAHGEFGSFMGRVPYFHALALAPFVRGMPLGVFSIQRRRQDHDFDDDERELFRRFVGHAAAAIDHRRLIAGLNRIDATAALVVSREGRILSATDEAREILESLPRDKVFSLPSTADRPRVWVSGLRAYVVRSVAPTRDSLLDKLDGANISWCADGSAMEGRIRMVPEEGRERFVVIIEPLGTHGKARGKLVGFGFTERQEEVAVLLILGRRPKEIAALCGISINTVGEHIEQLYRKLDVRSREEFLGEVLGAPVGRRRA